MDPLVEIPQEQWPQLRDEFKKHWPFGLPGYYLLETQILHPNIGSSFQFKIHCPYGDMSQGIIAFNVKGDFNEIIILPTSTDTDKILEALSNTSQIDWTKELLCVPYADESVIRLMPALHQRLGIRSDNQVPTIKHYLDKNSPLYEITCPENTYTGPLKLDNITQIDKVWPHRYSTSHMFFKVLIENDQSYGLFSSEDDSLLAWVVKCEAGFLTHLYCEEEHRRKGYSEYLLKYVCNDDLRKGKDLYCYILPENISSLKLFGKIGFKIFGKGAWTYITKA